MPTIRDSQIEFRLFNFHLRYTARSNISGIIYKKYFRLWPI